MNLSNSRSKETTPQDAIVAEQAYNVSLITEINYFQNMKLIVDFQKNSGKITFLTK